MSWCHIYYITSVILYIYSGYVTGSEYYVSADPNGESCPTTHLPCHSLSFYTADSASYFTDDAIFFFLEGIHTLKGLLLINNVSNITLQGLGHIEQGFHETVMQSTSVIKCNNYNRSGIQFTSSSGVVLSSLTIANCGAFYTTSQGHANISLLLADITNVTLEWVSVQNGSGIGLHLYNAFDVLIANSTFANNGANAIIFYGKRLKILSQVNIVKSNFTLSLEYGMALLFFNENNDEVEVIIENNKILHNTAKYGGGVLINLHVGSGSIEFSNCIIYNNTAWKYGGGVYIEVKRDDSIEFNNFTTCNNNALCGGGEEIHLDNGSGSIKFSNCTIYNNTALYGGGGYIYLHKGSGSIEFSNCTLYSNTAWQYGGGVEIEIKGGGNIDFSNCTIYNNTAQYGGGVEIQLENGSGCIEFDYCIIYNNTAQYGGGVYIYLHKRSGSIEYHNCTIYNNIAYYGSGLFIIAFQVTSTSSIQFSHVLFHFNKIPNLRDKHQSAVFIVDSNHVIFDQIEISNHA